MAVVLELLSTIFGSGLREVCTESSAHGSAKISGFLYSIILASFLSRCDSQIRFLVGKAGGAPLGDAPSGSYSSASYAVAVSLELLSACAGAGFLELWTESRAAATARISGLLYFMAITSFPWLLTYTASASRTLQNCGWRQNL